MTPTERKKLEEVREAVKVLADGFMYHDMGHTKGCGHDTLLICGAREKAKEIFQTLTELMGKDKNETT